MHQGHTSVDCSPAPGVRNDLNFKLENNFFIGRDYRGSNGDEQNGDEQDMQQRSSCQVLQLAEISAE